MRPPIPILGMRGEGKEEGEGRAVSRFTNGCVCIVHSRNGGFHWADKARSRRWRKIKVRERKPLERGV